MSMEHSTDDNVAIEVPSSISGCHMVRWEDIAIVTKDTRYSTNDNTTSTTDAIESSWQQQHIDSYKAGEVRKQQLNDNADLFKDDSAMPSPIPVGSNDDSWSSDSTESSGISTSNCSDGGSISKDSYDDDNLATSHELQRLISLETDETCGFVTADRVRNVNPSTHPKVQFSTVQVRDYAIILGDHPYCDMYPLSLDWNYVEALTTTTDEFEVNHRRRIPNDMKVFSPVVARKNLRKGKGMNNSSGMMNVRARKLSVMERMSLLIEFTGCSSQQLYQLERKRQLLKQDEKFLIASTESLTII